MPTHHVILFYQTLHHITNFCEFLTNSFALYSRSSTKSKRLAFVKDILFPQWDSKCYKMQCFKHRYFRKTWHPCNYL